MDSKLESMSDEEKADDSHQGNKKSPNENEAIATKDTDKTTLSEDANATHGESKHHLNQTENVLNEKKAMEMSSEQNEGESRTSKSLLCNRLPKRYLLLLLVFLGFVNIYGLRVNLNVALVAMVNNRTVIKAGVQTRMPAEFHWDSKTQGDAV